MKSLVQRFNNHYTRHMIAANISYNTKSTLDIYAVSSDSDQKRPIIVFWYGGSWQNGDKATYRFVADYLARKTGAIVIIPNYEKYPSVQYPYFIDEAWQAIKWVQDHAHEYGGDVTRYSVIGHSSGAHTACSIALGARKPAELALPEKCVSLAGPNNEVGEALWPVFAVTQKDFTTFPVYFTTHTDQPTKTQFMLLQGWFDFVVSPTQFTRFLRVLRMINVSVVAKRPFATHVGIIIGLGSPFAATRVYARQVAKFLKNQNKRELNDESKLE